MKRVVFDSSSLISISENCLINVLGKLVEKSKAELIITPSVEFESVLRPLRIKRFELNALRLQRTIEAGWLKVWRKGKIKEQGKRIERIANQIFSIGKRNLSIIQLGETDSLALAKLVKAKVFVIDERTTRMLLEDPKGLQGYLNYKYETNVSLNKTKLSQFLKLTGKINIARSVDLLAYAFEKGFFDGELKKEKKSLEAALYAAKYSGCSVSLKEIKEYLKVKK